MPTKEIRWPLRGVVRRIGFRTGADARGPYPSVWSVNVRNEGNLDRRLRGGSRPGLTKFVTDDFGTTIADIASVNLGSATGASETLFVLVDSTIKTVTNGTVTTQTAYLTDESNNILTDESDNRLVVGTATAPSSGFLVVGQSHVFAVTTSGVTKMDPKTGQTDTLVASAGTIPTSCTFGAVYRDRLCMSGEDNAIYMSRKGDYTDWDYGAHFEDQNRAVPFQLSLSADVGALPTAMIPVKDDYMVCATARSLWVVQGDPTTGRLERISEEIGIISSRAWCRVDDVIVFLSEDGVCMLRGTQITQMTPDLVPEELRDVNPSTTTATIGYDQDKEAYHIYLRTSDGTDTHWVYEVETQAFWAVRHQVSDHSPLAVVRHEGELLLAGADGYIRKVTGTDDDGTAIESHAVLGPMRVAGPNQFGRILHLHANLAAGSGTVNWRLVTGKTAEEAADNAKLAVEAFQAGTSYASYVSASGEWTTGRANRVYPRTRAVWVCLWLQSADEWSFEGVVMESAPSGAWRGA